MMEGNRTVREPVRTAEGLGNRIRALRRRRELTLEQLSVATGLNKGYLSRIENGEKLPSISTVLKIAQALEVPTGQLFGETVDDDDIHVVRSADKSALREQSGSGQYAIAPLSDGARASQVQAYLVHPSSHFDEDDRAQHAGTEAVYVIDGRVAIAIADRIIEMSVGDYIQFPGHLTHHVRRVGAKATVLIVIAHG